jgi:hypothetical protein
LSLNGLTDARLRVTGAVADGRVLLTGGVNLPMGTTGLDADQTTVLQAVGSPALHMPIGGLGIGPGGTLGLIAGREAGVWALALGASLEARSEYTPMELSLANGTNLTKVAPGTAMHLTFGGDRPAGDGRFALLLVGDVYTNDQITTGPAGSATTAKYTLGPQFTAVSRLDFAVSGWREAGANVALRHRTDFRDGSGAGVAGSSATYLDGSLTGIRGGSGGRGLVLGLDGRHQSGFTSTDALVGASVNAAGATLGVEVPAGGTVLRLAARGQYGQFKTRTASSNGIGLSLVGVIAARRGAQ